jgi:hypothetical protein
LSDPPPPTPEKIMPSKPQLPQMIAVPLEIIKTIAEIYGQNRGMARGVARMMGYTIPKELEEFLEGLAGDNPEKIQEVIDKNNPYNVDQIEIPAPKIGERVLTQDIAQQAWELHYKHHWTFRQIAEYLTGEGYPVSHTTVSNYISEIDEDIDEEQHSKSARVKRALLITAGVVGPSLVTFLLVHFLRL